MATQRDDYPFYEPTMRVSMQVGKKRSVENVPAEK